MSTKKHSFIWIRVIVFLVLLGLVLGELTRIFVPKYFYNQEWPMTSVFSNFYDIEENSAEVIFLGSSRSMTTFSPQELYDKYGITSYNLGSTQQNILLSYYWLKEALRFQTPKAVVLDVKELFLYREGVELNADEAAIRKALDYMKWSSVKKEAVDDICKIDESQDKISYYFPIFRYHTRWKKLKEDDFSYFEMVTKGEIKGYTPISELSGKNFTPIEPGSSNECEEMVELMLGYMDRIVELCREKDIQLILVNTPYTACTIEKYNSVAKYAQENQVPYYDFNVKELYEEVGYDFAVDNADKKHANIWGATKITDYIGKILLENYHMGSREYLQWEETAEYYEQVKDDCELTRVTDIHQYLKRLQDERYSILIAVKGDASQAIDEETLGLLRNFGIAAPLDACAQASYYAIIDGDYVYDQLGGEMLSTSGALRNGVESYEITSAGKVCGNSCSIKINGTKYAVNETGLNIVVYNNELKKVIDSVCFDTSSPELTVTR